MPPKSSLPVAFCLVIIWASSALAAPGADWPLYRRDVRLTSHSPGKGKLTAPVLRWRAFLGGRPAATRAHDADLDGTDDVLAIEGGSLSARSWSGGVLWKSAPNGAMQAKHGCSFVNANMSQEPLEATQFISP